MFFKQYYLGCLAHASYMVASQGVGAVIDPQRDVDEYIEDARREGFEIVYVIETHLHADFVSGHRELASRTGAQIVFGADANADFPFIAAKDGDELPLGGFILRILETPGHTPESISIVLMENNQPSSVFTGDTLFIGDVGRPDLVAGKGWAPDVMAGMLYDSIFGKLLQLPDNVKVYPAHGAGSLCGKRMSTEKVSTMGEQRKFNYALKTKSKPEFISLVLADQPEAPAYFPSDVEFNRKGAGALADLPALVGCTAETARKEMQQGAVLLDCREGAGYHSGYIEGAVNIGLSGQFASWAGTLLPIDARIILLADDPVWLAEAQTRLARIGMENVAGYLDGGISAWRNAGFEVKSNREMDVSELRLAIAEGLVQCVVDVRRKGEYRDGHVPEAINIPLSELETRLNEIDRNKPTAIICQSGYRSSIACSLLNKHAYNQVIQVEGGTRAWVEAEFLVVNEAPRMIQQSSFR